MKHLRFTVLVFTLLCFSVTFANANTLLSEITTDNRRSLDLSFEGAWVNFKLTNNSNDTVYFLKYETPLGALENDLFEITLEGEKIAYKGRLVLRKGPIATDWVALAPGASTSFECDLSKFYNLNRVGSYRVKYRSMVHTVQADSAKDLPALDLDDVDDQNDPRMELLAFSQMIQSNEIHMVVDGTNSVQDDPTHFSANSRATCSSGELSTLRGDQSTGRSQAYNSASRVGNNNWYINWFGAYNSFRASTVRRNYNAMGSALGQSTNYDCSSSSPCKSNWWAYVYPSYPNNIWICNLYWSEGGSIRGSILLHEASHWNSVAGTADHVYGYQGSRDLASTDPNSAITNADNYRYGALY